MLEKRVRIIRNLLVLAILAFAVTPGFGETSGITESERVAASNAQVDKTTYRGRALETSRKSRTAWLDSAAGIRLGFLNFELRGEQTEWNLGLGSRVNSGFNPWSFLGAGLSLTRPPREEYLLPEHSFFDEVGVKPWFGGCINCTLGTVAHLNFEMMWAPESATVIGGTPQADEGRVGVTLEFKW